MAKTCGTISSWYRTSWRECTSPFDRNWISNCSWKSKTKTSRWLTACYSRNLDRTSQIESRISTPDSTYSISSVYKPLQVRFQGDSKWLKVSFLADTNSARVSLELVRGIVDTVWTNVFLHRVPNGLSWIGKIVTSSSYPVHVNPKFSVFRKWELLYLKRHQILFSFWALFNISHITSWSNSDFSNCRDIAYMI